MTGGQSETASKMLIDAVKSGAKLHCDVAATAEVTSTDELTAE